MALPYSTFDDAVAHHGANAAAIAIPVASAAFRLPDYITMAVGLAGLLWYTILICEWVNKKIKIYRQFRQSNRRVAVVITSEAHISDAVSVLDENKP